MNFSGRLAGSACAAVVAMSAAAGSAHAQISVYAMGSADQMSNQQTSHTAGGATFGISGEFYRHNNLRTSADLRGFYYTGKGVEVNSGQLNLGGASVGAKVSYVARRAQPYAEIAVGFARYNDGLGRSNSGTTDSQLDGIFGLDVRLTPRFDLRAFEFDYKHYSALGGEFNPKVLSIGVVYHLKTR